MVPERRASKRRWPARLGRSCSRATPRFQVRSESTEWRRSGQPRSAWRCLAFEESVTDDVDARGRPATLPGGVPEGGSAINEADGANLPRGVFDDALAAPV